MSTICPRSLLALTIDVISQNCQSIFTKKAEHGRVLRHDVCLPPNISEKLLAQLIHNNEITTDILSLFGDPEVCQLSRFCVARNSCKNISWTEDCVSSLLQNQVLCELVLEDINIDFTANYSHYKIATSLKYLSLVPQDHSALTFILTFRHLKHLDVSNSIFVADAEIKLLASNLTKLESLNISSTNVGSAEAFGVLKVSLRSLYLHNIPLVLQGNFKGLLDFMKLQVLDISQSYPSITNNTFNTALSQFLMSSNVLKSLVSLDISGAGQVDNNILQSFIKTHPKLRFLGLLNVHQTSSHSIPQQIEVTGDESTKQLLTCLRYYKKRPSVLVKVLRELYRFSSQENLLDDVQQRKIVVELLLELMSKYMNKDNKDLQMAASACLFGYIKDNNSSGCTPLHVSVLSNMVSVIMKVLQTFPHEQQIQRNCLLTLYKNYILSRAKFDSFLLSTLIFNAISLFPNNDDVTAIGLDICAYLCAQITMTETAKLGTRENIEKLLSIINRQVTSDTVNALLHCALRVLWNLTDEAAKTCQVVTELRGLQLLMRAMKTFKEKHSVLKKILGILNNLAEVAELHPYLRTDELLSLLRAFLEDSFQLDVRYFAAGVMCNLLVNCSPTLPTMFPTAGSLADCLAAVGSAVSRWEQPDKAMVGYRSFKPFITLLRCEFSEVQLWSVWAIYHVCLHRVHRYGEICKNEGILDIFKELIFSRETRADVTTLAVEALHFIEKNYEQHEKVEP